MCVVEQESSRGGVLLCDGWTCKGISPMQSSISVCVGGDQVFLQ